MFDKILFIHSSTCENLGIVGGCPATKSFQFVTNGPPQCNPLQITGTPAKSISIVDALCWLTINPGLVFCNF